MNNANTASRILDRTSYDAIDCKILNKIAKLLIKHGAASVERLAKLAKYSTFTVSWALWHLEAQQTPAQLWVLP